MAPAHLIGLVRRNSSAYCLQGLSSELRDYLRDTGHFQKRPYHKKGMPSFYGRSLHSSSSDGTDYSTRRG